MISLLRQLEQEPQNVGKAIVTGFSQGGILSFATVALHPTRVDASLPIAGLLPPALYPKRAPSGSAPIFAFHGRADAIVPFDRMAQTMQHLLNHNYRVQLVEFQGVGHFVSREMRAAFSSQLQQLLRAPNSDQAWPEATHPR